MVSGDGTSDDTDTDDDTATEYTITIPAGWSSVQLIAIPLGVDGPAWDKTIQIELQSDNQPDFYLLGDQGDDDSSGASGDEDGSEDADYSGDAASDGMQATAYILNQDGIGGQVDQNVDASSTGQTEATISQGAVTVGLQQGDVSYSLPGPDGGLTPTYTGDTSVVPLVSVEMTLPDDAGDPSSVSAQLTLYDAEDDMRLTNSASFSTGNVPASGGALDFVLQGSQQIADELASGNYDYTVRFSFDIDGETHIRTVTGSTQIINLTNNSVGASQLGAGWSIDSLQSLIPDDGSASPLADNGLVVPTGMALIRGDGTAAYFSGTPNYNDANSVTLSTSDWSRAQASAGLANEENGYGDGTDSPVTISENQGTMTTTGDWQIGTDAGSPYLYSDDDNPATATWTVNGLGSGRQYQVLVSWNPGLDRTEDAPYFVSGADELNMPDNGPVRFDFNQQQTPGQIYEYDGQYYRSLGFYTLEPGDQSLSVELDTSQSSDGGANQEFVAGSLLVLANASGFGDNSQTTFTTPAGSHLNEPLTYNAAATTSSGDTFTYTDKDGTQYTFDYLGRLVDTTDRDNNNTVYAYSTQVGPDGHYDLLASITQQGGVETVYDYDGDGYLESITDAAGLVSTFDASGGELSSYSAPNPGAGGDAAPETMSFGYTGATDSLASITDGDGNTTTLNYGSDGRLKGGSNADGGSWSFTSMLDSGLDQIDAAPEGDVGDDSDEPEAEFTDPLGNTSYYQTDVYGLLTAQADPTGAVWTWQRQDPTTPADELGTSYFGGNGGDDDGLPTSSVEPAGGGGTNALGALTTTYRYDSQGNLIETDYPDNSGDPDGLTESWSYGIDSQLVYHDDPAGIATSYSLDANGDVTSQTVGNTITTFTYTPAPAGPGDLDSLPGGLVTSETVSSSNDGSEDASETTTAYYTPGDAPNLMSIGQPETVVAGIGILSNGQVDPAQQGVVTNYTYDTNGNLATSTLVMNAAPNGAATGLANRVTAYVYDALGQLVSKTEPDPATGLPTGPTTTYAYDGACNQISVTDALGNTTKYVYDPMGRLTQTIQPTPGGAPGASQANPTTVNVYDLDGNLTKSIDADGNSTKYTYDADGNKATETDPNGGLTIFTHDALGELISQTDPRGIETTCAYDAQGNQTQVTTDAGGPLQATTTTQYNGDGQATQVTAPGPNGVSDITTYLYDNQGELETETNPDPLNGQADGGSPTKTFTYDALGDVTSETRTNAAPEGGAVAIASLATAYLYNALGQLVSQTDPDPSTGQDDSGSPVTTYAYDNAGDVLTTTVAAAATGNSPAISRTTTDTYDADGNLVEAVGPAPGAAGEVASDVIYGYNADGEMTSEKDEVATSLGNTTWATTTFAFDNLGRQWQTIAPPLASGADAGLSPETETVYDPDGNVLQSQTLTAPNTWATTIDAYDPNGNLLTQTDPDGDKTTYTYDADGNQTSVTDPDGNKTTFTYNSQNELSGESRYTYESPSAPNVLVSESFSYDNAGDLTSETNFDGQTINYTHDQAGNVTSASSGGVTYSYAYDLLGDMLSAAGTTGTETLVYNADGEATADSFTGNGYNGPVTLTNTYDPLGERTTSSLTLGGVADYVNSYSYDGAGNETGVAQQGQAGGDYVAPKSALMTYDTAGDLLGVTRYNGANASSPIVASSAYKYDANGNLASLVDTAQGATLAGYAWSYNVQGEVAAFTNSQHAGENLIYGYDAAGQLDGVTGVNDPSLDEGYVFDANGNRQSATTDATTAGSSSGANNMLITDGTYTYQYDAEGNRIEETSIATGAYTTYAYDFLQQLTTVTSYTSAGAVTQTVNYTYDAQGRQISETVSVAGGATTTTKFIYDGENIVATLDGTNALTNRYLDGPSVDQVFADEQFTPTSAGQMPSAAGATIWPLVDNQGTDRDLVEYNATTGVTSVVDHVAYNSFGAVTNEMNAAIDYLFGYTGFVRDLATGLDQSQSREYDPLDGVWTQQDPIGFAGGQANLRRVCRQWADGWDGPERERRDRLERRAAKVVGGFERSRRR